MTDCAPLVIAQELGFFAKQGLHVELIREPGWATIREKICHGELHAAQAPASMVLELSLGYGSICKPCITAFVTAHNGNAITLSNDLWDKGVRDGHTLAEVIKGDRQKRYTFAGVLKYSSQHYTMRKWLIAHGINPGEDVDIAIVPPPQVHSCMKNGYLDGYCVAEPWSSIGLLNQTGWCTTLSSDFDPMHPEKVFMVTESFHEEDPGRHMALLKALWEAAVYCDQAENREEIAKTLSHFSYVDVPKSSLQNALVGPFNLGKGRVTDARDAIIFHRNGANRPSLSKAQWVLDAIEQHGLQNNTPRPDSSFLSNCFREDIYETLLDSLSENVSKPEPCTNLN